MTLESTLLRKLSDRPAAGARPLTVTDPDTGWTAALAAEAFDTVGGRLWEVTLSRPGLTLDAPRLKAVGDAMAARATGLLESLKLLEVDDARLTALLRSTRPTAREAGLFYYEVLVHGDGRVNLRRYAGSHEPGAKREQVSFTVTHEGLAKLAGDLTAAF